MFAEGAEWSAGAASTIRCQSCGNEPAAVHVVGVEGGSIAHTHLCHSCAEELAEQREAGSAMVIAVPAALSALIGGLMGKVESGAAAPAGESVTCRQCGTTTSDVVETGVLGCPACYGNFASYLEQFFIQGEAGEHLGKVPRRSHDGNLVRREVHRLRIMLRELVEHERFEEAAGVRDRLVELGEQLSTG